MSDHADRPDDHPDAGAPRATDGPPADADREPDPSAETGPPADPQPAPASEPLIASAPGVGTRIGAVNFSTLRPLGWVLTGVGVLGVLLVALSYVSGWLTISAESFGEVETASLGLGEAASAPLWLMYRVGTIAMVLAALALVVVPEAARQPVWLGGLTAAALSLLSTLIATVVIGAALSRAFSAYGIDASTPGVSVGYGWGMYAGYAGIVAVAAFIGFFDYLCPRPADPADDDAEDHDPRQTPMTQ